MTEDTLAEFREVLQRPKFAKQIRNRFATIEEIMQRVLLLIELYPVIPAPTIVEADPDDDRFVVCALSAGAKHLISSDSHLLDMGSYSEISFLTVREFLEWKFPYLLE